jgi:hypothetical protein
VRPVCRLHTRPWATAVYGEFRALGAPLSRMLSVYRPALCRGCRDKHDAPAVPQQAYSTNSLLLTLGSCSKVGSCSVCVVLPAIVMSQVACEALAWQHTKHGATMVCTVTMPSNRYAHILTCHPPAAQLPARQYHHQRAAHLLPPVVPGPAEGCHQPVPGRLLEQGEGSGAGSLCCHKSCCTSHVHHTVCMGYPPGCSRRTAQVVHVLPVPELGAA